MMSQIMRFPKSKSGFSQKLNQKKVLVMVELTVCEFYVTDGVISDDQWGCSRYK